MRRLCYTLALLASFFINTQLVWGQDASRSNHRNVELHDLSTLYDSDQNKQLRKHKDAYLMQIKFDQLPSKATTKKLEKMGVKMHSYISDNTYLVSYPQNLSLAEAKELGITAYGVQKGEQKIAKTLSDKNYPEYCVNGDKVELAFSFPRNSNQSENKELLTSYGVEILENQHRDGATITGLVDPAKVATIADEAAITFVDVVTPPIEMLNHEVRSLQQVNYVNSATGKNLNGSGVTIGVGDGGELGSHLDFEGRIINYANGSYASFGDHGDHVAGIVGGGGTLNPRHRGMASEAEFVIQKTSLITLYMPDYFADHNMVLTNNSYGTSFNCDLNGTYNYSSQTLDIQMRDYPEVLHVYAAGNSGNLSCEPYPAGYRSVLRYYQSAKNVLTVGNVDQNRVIKANSSRGPVLDGRLKPEICGVGTSVYSTGREFNYKSKSGTSMAAPAVTGTLGLMYESYRNENGGNNPKSALMKAIACNTADDLGNPGPDYIYGYGLINARRSIETIEAGNFQSDEISDGESNTHSISVPAGTSKVKVMLYWHDKEAETYPVKALVNNLDMVMTTPSGTNYEPWVLDHTATGVDDVATRGVDDLNNIEQITLDNPAAGNYTITIDGTEIPFGPQDYHITYEFVTDEVIITSPLGGEVFTPSTTEYIQWDVNANNTSTFKVEYSIDNGSSWNTLSANVPANQRFFSWSVPSSMSETAFVRVSKNDGSSEAENGIAFSILEQPVVTTEPICYGGVELSWDAVDMANAYEVLMFDGQEMVTLTTTSGLSYTLEGSSLVLGEKYWFSVVPILSSGNKGLRAIATSCVTQNNIVCPWPFDIYVQDLAVRAKGRSGTKSALSDDEPVTALIKNTGNNTVSDFDIYYSVNGGTAVVETYTGELASGDSIYYTFLQTVDMTEEGEYHVDAWTVLENDVHNNNDSLLNTYQTEQLSNGPIDLSQSALRVNFQTSAPYLYDTNSIGLEELDRWDFETVIDGTLQVGGQSTALELLIDESATDVASDYSNNAILTTNLADHNPNLGLAMDIVYSNNNLFPLEEGSELVNKIYVRGSDVESWVDLYTLNEAETGWHTVTGLNIMNALNSAGQSLTTSTQIRLEENGKGLLVDSIVIYETSALPVALMSFTAEKVGEDAVLKWATASEEDNRHFVIEVAVSESAFLKEEFEVLGVQEGRGTTSAVSNYVYVDETPSKNGNRYYRLKQVDFDGKFSFTEVRQVKFDNNAGPVAIYPNPAVDYAVIDFDKLSAKNLNISVVDASGVTVQHFTYDDATGVKRLRLDLVDIPEGVYYIVLDQDGSTKSYPLYKHRKDH